MYDSKKIKKKDTVIYPALSYKIVGMLYNIHNFIGGAHKEKFLQSAVEEELRKNNLPYKKELYSPLLYNDKVIGRYFLDFLIDDKIILELKKGERFSKIDIDQVLAYLKVKQLKLGLLANFTHSKVRIKRIININ